MNGMRIDVFRWLTEHFGHKVAGSPLNSLMLCNLRFLTWPTPGLGELRGASSKTLIGAVWADDTVLVDKVPPHGRCQGIRGDCVTCMQHLAHAKERQAFWIWLGAELGLEFAEDKRQELFLTTSLEMPFHCFPGAYRDRSQGAGDGCRMWYVNSWAMGWSRDM